MAGWLQTTKTISNFKLGATLVPESVYHNRSRKAEIKAAAQLAHRLTPFVGGVNYFGKVVTGKYFSDMFWDEVLD